MRYVVYAVSCWLTIFALIALLLFVDRSIPQEPKEQELKPLELTECEKHRIREYLKELDDDE